MKESVYIETSIVSYLTAERSRDLRAAAWQDVTVQWWKEARSEYDLFTSELVVAEAERGDPDAAARRLARLEDIPELVVDEEAEALAARILEKSGMPSKAENDALHAAISAMHGVDFLLTWNCRHLNNAAFKPGMRAACAIAGYALPEICTPMELLPEEPNDVQGRNNR